jgi:hypothetical protein
MPEIPGADGLFQRSQLGDTSLLRKLNTLTAEEWDELTFRLMKHFRRAMEGKGYVIHKQGEVCPDDPTIEQYVDEVERVLQPRGRCIECGGGEGYWRHKYADDARGYHLFTPETPHARMVRGSSIPFDFTDRRTGHRPDAAVSMRRSDEVPMPMPRTKGV